jgi:hypothetical protein
MRQTIPLWSVTLLSLPVLAAAQGSPLGPEFRVNTYTMQNQAAPSVAVDGAGLFTVVWASDGQDGSGNGVFGQRFDVSGAPLGPEFRVNTFTSNAQGLPSLAAFAAGDFVVVWESQPGQDGFYGGIFGQRYAASGAPQGPEFRVNSYTTESQLRPVVAGSGPGSFVVVWESDGQDGSGEGVFGQRYSSAGTPLGPEFRVNTFTSQNQRYPSVAADNAGNFVVVWQSSLQDGSALGIFGQRYAASGAPLGPEFRVNTYTTDSQFAPSVAVDGAGNFVVAWESFAQAGSSFGVFGQRFAGSGAPLGPEFQVSVYTTDAPDRPVVAADGVGNFVVVWQPFLIGDGSGTGVFGRRFADSGAPLDADFRVNSYTTNDQIEAAVAADLAGRFVVVWRSDGQDGSGQGVFAQRYAPILPVELTRLSVE